METNEEPSVIYSIYRDTDAEYVLFVTKNGLVKKTALDEYNKGNIVMSPKGSFARLLATKGFESIV